MKAFLLLLSASLPLLAQAASGSWAEGSEGIELKHGETVARSKAIRPGKLLAAGDARMTSVSWRYKLLSVEPPGLQVKLCTPNRCTKLDAAKGTSDVFRGEPANTEFRFIYYVGTRGELRLPFRVLGNEIIVNYEQ